jgi:hypothetical protein
MSPTYAMDYGSMSNGSKNSRTFFIWRSLRAIIAELLIKNQNLRWELQGHGCWPGQDPKLLTASVGTPLRRKSSTAGIP